MKIIKYFFVFGEPQQHHNCNVAINHKWESDPVQEIKQQNDFKMAGPYRSSDSRVTRHSDGQNTILKSHCHIVKMIWLIGFQFVVPSQHHSQMKVKIYTLILIHIIRNVMRPQ